MESSKSERGDKYSVMFTASNYDLKWHVRAFADGRLESELEPPRTTIRHLLVWPSPHDGLLAQLLTRIRFHSPINPQTFDLTSRKYRCAYFDRSSLNSTEVPKFFERA